MSLKAKWWSSEEDVFGQMDLSDAWNLDDEPFDADPTQTRACLLHLAPHVRMLMKVGEAYYQGTIWNLEPIYSAFILCPFLYLLHSVYVLYCIELPLHYREPQTLIRLRPSN